MKLSQSALFFVVFVGAAACGSCSKPPPPRLPVLVTSDAGLPPAVFSDDCAGACFYWRRAACPEGDPAPGGASCEDVCRNLTDAGIDGAKQLSCASTATSCAAIRACPY